MATIKSYTDISQSKTLSKILPLESADMYYCYGMNIHTIGWSFDDTPTIIDNNNRIDVHKDIPCWSLAALLEQLDDEITDDNGNDYNLTIVKESLQYQLYYHDSWDQVEDIETNYYDDLVDACVDMIEKLHEQNIL